MPFRVLKDTSVRDVNNDGGLHPAGTILSDWEVEPFVKGKIEEGSLHYRSLFEPLTDKEAFDARAKETVLEGDRSLAGVAISPPFKDYVGLHPEEIIQRMKDETDRIKVQQVRDYEKAGLARSPILDYVSPCERPPFFGYDDMGVREVLEKLEVLSPEAVAETLSYEFAHRKRPAILTYEREVDSAESEKEPVTA